MGLRENLKAARKRAGMTQKQAAEAMGITESTYCGYETGKRLPDALKIRQLAALFDVSGDYLLGLVDDPDFFFESEVSDQDPQIEQLLSRAGMLNAQGLQKLIDYAEDLAESAKYLK